MGQPQPEALHAQLIDALSVLAQAASRDSRRLVTARIIDAIEPIPEADAIEVAVLGGWKVVVKKNEFKAGDPCLYFEIDSFLPDGEPAWQFLVDKSPRMFNGVRGHKLRTVKLRGQISQGFVLAYTAFPEVVAAIQNLPMPEGLDETKQAAFKDLVYGMHEHEAGLCAQDMDFSALLGVVKWDPPLPAELAGQAEGLFPSFIPKTDEERCQNLVDEIFGYEPRIIPAEGERPEIYRPAKADRNAQYEVTIKLDGSSMTVFHRDGKVGVCSRNLELKISEANKDNTFVRMLFDSGLDLALPQLGNIAIQGELMGPNIQNNREGLKDFKFFIFNAVDIGTRMYLTPPERTSLYRRLLDLGVNPNKVEHVPVLYGGITLQELGLTNIEELLAFAEGPSLVHPVREGVVFKKLDGTFSFKAISNAYLAKLKD